MKITNSNYQKKLIVFGLMLGTLPVILLGIFSYYKSSSIIQDKVNQTNLQVLQQTEMRVEEVLKSIQYYYVVMANSSTVNDYLDKQLTYTDYDAVVAIQRALVGMQTVQASVKGAYYANFDHNWVIGNEGMTTLSEKFNMDQIDFIKREPKNSFWVLSKEDSPLFIQSESQIFKPIHNISLVIKVPLNSNAPQGALVIALQGNEFMKSAAQRERLDEMIILDNKYEFLLRDGKPILSDNDSATFLSGIKDRAENHGFYKSKINNKSVGISYRKSNYNGWTYVSIYNISDITKDSRAIGWVTFLICIIIMLCVGLVSILGSSVIYMPIKNIYETIMKNMGAVNNTKGKDEITYIGEGINNLFTRQTQMVEQIKHQIMQIEELFIRKLVKGELNNDEIDDKLRALGHNGNWKWFTVLSAQMDSLDSTKYSEKDRDLLLFSINNIICEVMNENIRFRPAFIEKSQVILIRGNQQQTYEEVKKFAYTCASIIQENVMKHLDLSVSIGISRPFHELNAAQIAYKESMEALMCSIRFGEGTILYFEDVQPNGQIKQIYPKNLEDELINAINHSEVEKAEELLDHLIDNFFNKELSFSEYQISLTRLLINIIGILQDSGESISILFDKQNHLFDELYRLRNSYQIKNWFKASAITPVIKCLEERRGSQYKSILDEVISMIEIEYDTDISLESCAARLNYHPNYIWRVLKKEMDITFSEYLSKCRLIKAKQLLEESDTPIGEIAEMLRYNNSQNFIRYFKKLEGVTPGQYRERFRSNS